MNHPLLASYALLPLVHLDSYLSILQNTLKVHQDLLLHTSFLGALLCVCFRGSLSKKCLSCSGITQIWHAQSQDKRGKTEEERKAKEALQDKGFLIQVTRVSCKVCTFSRVTCPEIICHQAVTWDNCCLPVTEPITSRRRSFFNLLGQNKRERSPPGFSLNRLPLE